MAPAAPAVPAAPAASTVSVKKINFLLLLFLLNAPSHGGVNEKEKMALRKAWKKGAEKISSHETERDWLGDDLVSR